MNERTQNILTVIKELSEDSNLRLSKQRSFIEELKEFSNDDKNSVRDIYEVFLNTLPIYQENAQFWNLFGVFQQRIDLQSQALVCFERAYEIDQHELYAFNNICNIRGKMVEQWHFRMLNSVARNEKYKSAINNRITEGGFNDVLDIGTGTGLLSLYACQSNNVKYVTACEMSRSMQTIARNVFRDNNVEVTQIDKSSLEMDETKKFSLIVTEIVDVGVFGEGILKTLIDAKKRLLKENGVIIPQRVELLVCGYQSKQLFSQSVCSNVEFQQNFNLKDYIIKVKDEPYEQENLIEREDLYVITNIQKGISVDFNNLADMEETLMGDKKKDISFVCEQNGFIDGFAIWFNLHLDETNTIETKPSKQNCWDQAVIPLNCRYPVESGQSLNIVMSCKDELLNIEHEYNRSDKMIIETETEVIRFLNDLDYLKGLDEAVGENEFYSTIVDVSTFPYIGLKLLKAGRTDQLFIREFTELIASIVKDLENGFDKVHVIEDWTTNLDRINLLVWSPVSIMGYLDDDLFLLVSELEKNTTIDRIIPQQLNVVCELIRSSYIQDVTRIINPEIIQLKIESYMKGFQTELQLQLEYFDYHSITGPITMAMVPFDMDLHVTNVDFKTINENCDGILCYFNWILTNQISISSKRNFSHVHRMAFPINKSEGKNISGLKLIQNNGILKCDLN